MVRLSFLTIADNLHSSGCTSSKVTFLHLEVSRYLGLHHRDLLIFLDSSHLLLCLLQSVRRCLFSTWKSSFLCPWDPFFPKTLEQPREVKNGLVLLKFGALLDWMNTWGLLFIFWKSFFLGSWDPFFPISLCIS